MPYKILFIIEQALGHITHGQNLRKNVALDPNVQAYWGLPAWQTAGMTSKLPVYKNNWTLQAGLQARRLLIELCRTANPDVLFFHTQVAAMLSQDWMRSIPSVISLDATPRQYDRLGDVYAHKTGPGWLEHLKWLFHQDCFQQARYLVSWSEWAKKSLVEEYGIDAEKIVVIPPGVNIHEWTRPDVEPTVSSLSNGQADSLPYTTVRILFVGGDLKRKGGLLLLEAFRRLRGELSRRNPPIHLELHLVTHDSLPGEPGLFVYNQLQPNTPVLKQLYFNSDIFCLPTYGDCLPMALSEAGAAGLPLVSTNIAAIPEIVRDGQTGLLISTGDVESLVIALRKLAIDPQLRQSMGIQAAGLVGRSYDAEKNASKLLKLLKFVADDGVVGFQI